MRSSSCALTVLFLLQFLNLDFANASCSGQQGEALRACQAAESSMLVRAHERNNRDRKIPLTVRIGKTVKTTNKYDLYNNYSDECDFIAAEGTFEVMSQSKSILGKGSCKCCTNFEVAGPNKWIPKYYRWRRHGAYVFYNENKALEKLAEYWCGFKKETVNDLVKEMTKEGCTIPLSK